MDRFTEEMIWSAIRSERMAVAGMPTRTLGKTGVKVSVIGIGGQGRCQCTSKGSAEILEKIVQTAHRLGVRFVDTAPEYSPSEERLGDLLKDKGGWFISSKSNARKADAMKRQLEQSLKNLKVDKLDMWSFHSVKKGEDKSALKKDGPIDTLKWAKDQGMVLRIGITGHQDPATMARIIEGADGALDYVLCPVNPADTRAMKDLIPVARKFNCGVGAMKVMGRRRLITPSKNGVKTAEEAVRYTMSQDTDVLVIGFSFSEEVEEVVKVAKNFEKMSAQKQHDLEDAVKSRAQKIRFYEPGSGAGWIRGGYVRKSLEDWEGEKL